MANLPFPLALLLQASELARQRFKEYMRAHLVATAHSDVLEVERSPEFCDAQRALDDANAAYSRQACRVLAGGTLVVTSMEEIEALLVVLRRVPPQQCLSVVILGPESHGNLVDHLVAQMRATLESEGFVLRPHGQENVYDLLKPFVQAAQQAPVQQPAGGQTSRRQTKRQTSWRQTKRRQL